MGRLGEEEARQGALGLGGSRPAGLGALGRSQAGPETWLVHAGDGRVRSTQSTQGKERCGCSLAFDLKQGRQEAVRCRGRRGAEATAAETGRNGEGGWIHLGAGEAA